MDPFSLLPTELINETFSFLGSPHTQMAWLVNKQWHKNVLQSAVKLKTTWHHFKRHAHKMPNIVKLHLVFPVPFAPREPQVIIDAKNHPWLRFVQLSEKVVQLYVDARQGVVFSSHDHQLQEAFAFVTQVPYLKHLAIRTIQETKMEKTTRGPTPKLSNCDIIPLFDEMFDGGYNQTDITLVMSQAEASKKQAVDALRSSNGDMIDAIMVRALTNITE